MVKILKAVSAMALCAVLAAGCATTQKVSDEEMIQTTLSKVKDALEKKDIELLMATFSESFQDPRVGDKMAAKALLEQGLNSGYADNGEVRIDKVVITLGEDKKTATVYPLDLSSSAGAISVELVLAKEKDGWFVTAVNADGV
jgi:hypothetical protein